MLMLLKNHLLFLFLISHYCRQTRVNRRSNSRPSCSCQPVAALRESFLLHLGTTDGRTGQTDGDGRRRTRWLLPATTVSCCRHIHQHPATEWSQSDWEEENDEAYVRRRSPVRRSVSSFSSSGVGVSVIVSSSLAFVQCVTHIHTPSDARSSPARLSACQAAWSVGRSTRDVAIRHSPRSVRPSIRPIGRC